MRGKLFGALALGLLLSACGGTAGDGTGTGGGGSGGSGSGGGGSGGGGGGGGGVAVLSHMAGADCLSCHRTGGSGAAKGVFTVAGTVYGSGGGLLANATVTLYPSGSNTAQATLTTDGIGNFFTTQAVAALVPAAGQQFALGVTAVVKPSGGSSRTMAGVVTNGSCNACHSPSGGVGRITAALDANSVETRVRAMAAAAQGAPTPMLAQIAVGPTHGCIVKTDGQVQCWGEASGEALDHLSASTADGSIAAGRQHTCVVSALSGNVLCWGANDVGQLGNGTTDAARVSAVALSGVTALAAVGDATCARTGVEPNAVFYCWGTGASFSSVNPVQVRAESNEPALVSLLAGGNSIDVAALRNVAGLDAVSFTRVAGSQERGCGITRDDRVKCWEGQRASVDMPL